LERSKISLADRATGADRFLSAGLFTALVLLAAGLSLPIAETQRLMFLPKHFQLLTPSTHSI